MFQLTGLQELQNADEQANLGKQHNTYLIHIRTAPSEVIAFAQMLHRASHVYDNRLGECGYGHMDTDMPPMHFLQMAMAIWENSERWEELNMLMNMMYELRDGLTKSDKSPAVADVFNKGEGGLQAEPTALSDGKPNPFVGRKRYRVTYYYMVQGMDGPDERDMGTHYGLTREEAISKVVNEQYPDPRDAGRMLFRSCLTAKLVE
jgi:hypothetical protein